MLLKTNLEGPTFILYEAYIIHFYLSHDNTSSTTHKQTCSMPEPKVHLLKLVQLKKGYYEAILSCRMAGGEIQYSSILKKDWDTKIRLQNFYDCF